jgi:hypothetical protein
MRASNTLQRLGTAKLFEANQKATELLLKGTVVDGVEGWEQGRGRTVHFIDWEHPERNAFRVINQFRLDEPGGQAKKYIAPDLVLFVNGIPLVVIEAKSPYLATPMEDAVNQLQRYANRRKGAGGGGVQRRQRTTLSLRAVRGGDLRGTGPGRYLLVAGGALSGMERHQSNPDGRGGRGARTRSCDASRSWSSPTAGICKNNWPTRRT